MEQTRAQLTTELSKENRKLMGMRKKRNPQIASWLDENDLPLDLKEKIMTCALNELKADEDIDIKNIHYILPWKDLINIKRHLCLDTLKRVSFCIKNGNLCLNAHGHSRPTSILHNTFSLDLLFIFLIYMCFPLGYDVSKYE